MELSALGVCNRGHFVAIVVAVVTLFVSRPQGLHSLFDGTTEFWGRFFSLEPDTAVSGGHLPLPHEVSASNCNLWCLLATLAGGRGDGGCELAFAMMGRSCREATTILSW